MSDAIKSAIENIAREAIEIAMLHQHEFVTLEHVVSSLIRNEKIKEFFKASSLDITKVEDAMKVFMSNSFIEKIPANTPPFKSKDFESIFFRTIAQVMFSTKMVDASLEILLNMFQIGLDDDSYALNSLMVAGVTSEMIRKYINTTYGVSQQREGVGGEHGGEAAPKTPEDAKRYLEKYCVNLNEEAQGGRIDPLIGRAIEVQEMIKITARRTKNNSVLVGDPGVGKTAIVEGLAYNITKGNVPDILKDKTVYSLDLGALVAGTRFRGDFEERMKNVLISLEILSNGILFIDEIHMILDAGAGGKGNMDVANLLKPALAKGRLTCIGSTTQEEFRKYFEKDRALLRRFKKVQIDEPSVELTKQILRGLRKLYEAHHGVTYTDAALDAAVDLTSKYVHSTLLPDKAIDILDSAGATQRILPEEQKLKIIDVLQIEAEVSKVAKIPESEVHEDEKEKLRKLEGNLKQAVYGQDLAIETLVSSIYVTRAGLRDRNKPAGSYLFVGYTGTGKTETAVQISNTMGIPLVKFDMSEYMERHAVSKLIGSPPGYVGFGEGAAGSGLLINAIDTTPSCVLLLDEIEKAHPDLLNLLLQVMDSGKMTSSDGKTVNFRNVILIMTSNAGAAALEKNSIGFSKFDQAPMNDEAVKRMFTPEFRNRLDGIIPFGKLKPEVMVHIVEKFMRNLNDLAAERNVSIVLDEAAKQWLAVKGYDTQMGARPLGRVIQENISKPLSREMLFGKLSDGGVANITVLDDKLVIQ